VRVIEEDGLESKGVYGDLQNNYDFSRH